MNCNYTKNGISPQAFLLAICRCKFLGWFPYDGSIGQYKTNIILIPYIDVILFCSFFSFFLSPLIYLSESVMFEGSSKQIFLPFAPNGLTGKNNKMHSYPIFKKVSITRKSMPPSNKRYLYWIEEWGRSTLATGDDIKFGGWIKIRGKKWFQNMAIFFSNPVNYLVDVSRKTHHTLSMLVKLFPRWISVI